MIHPSAFVHPSAKVHDTAVIGPWCLVDAGAEIAEEVVLEARVHVYGGVSIGKGTHVFDGAVLGAPPQDLKYNGEDTRLEIGENCIIREYCTLNRGTAQGGGVTRLADKVLLMTYSHVGHDCLIEEGAVISSGCQLGGHARIGRYATLGGNVGMPQRLCLCGGHPESRKGRSPCKQGLWHSAKMGWSKLARIEASQCRFFRRAYRRSRQGVSHPIPQRAPHSRSH